MLHDELLRRGSPTVLVFLISVLALLTNGQQQYYGDCDYAQVMVPGQKYYAFNREYPQNYSPGTSCRWILTSDRPININCNPINIPPSQGCSQEYLLIRETARDADAGHRYCGKGNFSTVANSGSVTLLLASSDRSKGGYFLCTLSTTSDPLNPIDNCKCGWKNPKKIVGGVETGVNEFPMMAGLVDVVKKIIICGATIINEKQVLTAAHCISGRVTDQIAVIVGEHDTSTGLDTNATRLLRVESYVLHSEYDPRTTDNDIALVTVILQIEFNQRVGPVCLPFRHSADSFTNDPVEILGWGFTKFAAGKSKTLQKAQVKVISNRDCAQAYPDLTYRQICTYDQVKDSCTFDSGGPVLWTDPQTRRLVGVGIISLGSYCGDGQPGQNTRVGAYIDWILRYTYKGIKYCTAE